MNYLWGIMMLIGVIYGALTGNLEAVTEQALSSAKEAVNLCITMAGVMAFWVGMMQIADSAGIMKKAARKVILMDSSKCGKIFPYKFGEIEDVDYIISNRNLLGPHHYIDKSSRNAVGPYVWELSNAWVKDEKTGYRSNYEFIKLCAN